MTGYEDQKLLLRKDGTPYNVQVAAILRRQIADETWAVGDQLPTLKELVATFGVSPMTMRHALARLELQGLIRAERGRGTFVTGKPNTPGSVPYGLTDLPPGQDQQLSFRVVESRPAQGELRVSERDGIAKDEYVYMKRIFLRNGGPFISAQYLVASDVHDMIPQTSWDSELISTLLYDTKAAGLAHVRQTFRVIASMPQEAAELEIRSHDPVVQVRRIFQDSQKNVICLAQLVYRTDGVVFDINIDLENRSRLLELGGMPET